MNMSDHGFGSGFALIVVLFILLIIVGASWVY
ncbi:MULTISPECIES: YjcZ family sporulation protein [unclassified Bacillus (in: firmicutes)]|nr:MULTISPECIES: YjcZ family sporulation protein [unclassified Bacillus (in: firmicutes)]